MNKQELAARIWESANQMRSKIEASEYKDYILGFIFYKFLSDRQLIFLRNEGATEEEILDLTEDSVEYVEHIRSNLGYFISYPNLYSTWVSKGHDFDISDVRDGLSAFSRKIDPTHRKVFDGIFTTLETGLSKLGDTAARQTKAARDLIHLIKDIPTNGQQDYDVLGYVYEYLISHFAANAGKKAGEFYTPHEVALLMSQIVADHLKDRNEIEIYDPTSGSGSLLINIGTSVGRYLDDVHKIKYFAQELKQNTYNLTRMNLVMRGIKPSNIVTRNADTLEEDWPFFLEEDPVGSYEPLFVDAVVSNPPYSQKWDPEGKETDPRYARYGLAPKTKADYAFLLHDLYHLKPDGIVAIVLPHGVLFRGGEEGKIRQNLVEKNHIEAIIGLPEKVFFGTGIPTIIMVLKENRSTTDTVFIDASHGFVKDGKTNKLRASDLRRIFDVVTNPHDVPSFARVVSREEIRRNDYNLNIPRYVDSRPPAETWDLHASMFGGIPKSEIDQLEDYWQALSGLREDLFTTNSRGNLSPVTENLNEAVITHPSVQEFTNQFEQALTGLDDSLQQRLVENRMTVHARREDNAIATDIFHRITDIPLVDKYDAFQVLQDNWQTIALDLEVLQTEGDEAIRTVEPNIVQRTKSGKKVEVQEGWIGRVIPFDLVQATILAEPADALRDNEASLETTEAAIGELVESLSEDDKLELAEVLNANDTDFLIGAVNKAVRELRKSRPKDDWEEDTPEFITLQAKDLLDQRKELKKQVKDQTAALHTLTKTTIENLTDAQADELLTAKWVTPIVAGLNALPTAAVADLCSRLTYLSKKYETTFAELEEDITETAGALDSMLGDLTGSGSDIAALDMFRTLLGGE